MEYSLGNTGLDYSVYMVIKTTHLKGMLFNFSLTSQSIVRSFLLTYGQVIVRYCFWRQLSDCFRQTPTSSQRLRVVSLQ
jgi:hypothetical protein